MSAEPAASETSALPPKPPTGERESSAQVLARVKPRTWRQALWLRAQWLCILLTWYLLLIGPLFWTWHHSVANSEPSWVEFLYRPLVYACEYPPVRSVVNAWIDLWIL